MAERILVVDDEPDILDLVELTLASRDFEVDTATNGREALEKARSGRPDLVLLDLSMPDMDGFEVIERLRSDARTSELPVIMLTARAQISDKLRGLSTGADDYITKPFNLDDLVSRVSSVLERSRKPAYSSPLLGALGEWSGEIEQLARHLETAAQIQRSLLPAEAPQLPGFSLTGELESSLNVSGDFYDFIPLDGGRFGVTIADIRGKGVPAAMLMVMVRTVLRIVAREVPEPGQVLKRINDFLAAETEPDLFATIVYGILDPRAWTFTYSNGGHCFPVLVNAERPETGRLDVGGTLVGVFDTAEFEEEVVELRQGDLILLYTDGVTETEGPDEERFGEERLLRIAEDSAGLTGAELCGTVRARLSEFAGTSRRADDVTLVAIQVESAERA